MLHEVVQNLKDIFLSKTTFFIDIKILKNIYLWGYNTCNNILQSENIFQKPLKLLSNLCVFQKIRWHETKFDPKIIQTHF